MLFSPLKHYLDLYRSDTVLKVSQSLHCFTTSICHGVENYFPRLWGTGISDAILLQRDLFTSTVLNLQLVYAKMLVLKFGFLFFGKNLVFIVVNANPQHLQTLSRAVMGAEKRH